MNLYQSNSYRIINEDGDTILTYRELLASPLIEQIREAKNGNSRVSLFLGRTILTFPIRFLRQDKSGKAQAFFDLEEEWRNNPLQFFAPSGPGAVDFINDVKSKVCFITAGNRGGKTVTALIKQLVGAVQTSKDWPLFTEHGVNWRPHRIHNVGIGSYEWGNHKKTIGPEVLKWVPRESCLEYVSKVRGGEGRAISWRENPILPFKEGSEFHFYAYNQDQAPFESEALMEWVWDEQPERPKWVGANERIRSFRYAQHNHVLTPHEIEGNPHTGGGTFLHQMWKKELLMGYTAEQITTHQIRLVSDEYRGEGNPEGDVPDWIYPEESKKEAYRQHIQKPIEDGDDRALRAGRARLYGEWESSEGLVIPEWNTRYHIIDPIPIPRDATLLRYVDHGRRNPCAALWGFVHPSICKTEAVLVLYREYYERGRTISENARGIVEASGNVLVPQGVLPTSGGSTYNRYEERFGAEKYYRCKMDSRSHASPLQEMAMSIGDFYRVCGLSTTPASGIKPENSVDVMRDWFRVDSSRNHPIYKDQMGFTKILVFSGLVNLRHEIENYVNENVLRRKGGEFNYKEKPKDKNNHLIDCGRWMLLDQPRFMSDRVSTRRSRLWDKEMLDEEGTEVFAGHQNEDRFTRY